MARNHRVSFAVRPSDARGGSATAVAPASHRLPSERDGDPHDRLMALRNQVVWDKASQRLIPMQIENLKAQGAADKIASLQEDLDRTGRRIREFEREVKEMETRLFGK